MPGGTPFFCCIFANADIVAVANECTFRRHPVIVRIVIAIAQLPGSGWVVLGGLEHWMKGGNKFVEWIAYDINVKHDDNNNNNI
jgi:hypothetical protein